MTDLNQTPTLDTTSTIVQSRDGTNITTPDQTSPSKTVRLNLKPTLSPLQIPISGSESGDERPEPPPRDKGIAAWTVLFAATIVSSFPCGIYLSYGVYQAYYKTAYPSSANSAWIGALSSGLPFLLAPLMVYICTHNTWSRIHFVWVGWLLGIIAMVGAAFSLNIKSLIITQGLVFGLSILVGDNPLLLVVNTWFRAHRGLAYGIIFGFCDLCGVAWSFLAEYLLQHLGQRKTFLIFAAIIFAVPGPCLLLLKERGSTNILHRSTLPSTPAGSRRGSGASGREALDDNILSPIGGNFELVRRDTPPTKKRFFRRPVFYVLSVANLVQSLAFYLPLIYLPTYALQLRSSSTTASTENAPSNSTGALALALVNLAQIVGEVLFGRLSDYCNVHILAIFSCVVASLSTFLLWGFATSNALLLSYAFVFGFSGAGFLALWARMGMIFGERDAMMVYATLNAGRGLGGIVSGPISVSLLGGGDYLVDGQDDDLITAGWANVVAHGKYRNLTIFVGICMAIAAVLCVAGFIIDMPEKTETKSKDGRVSGVINRMSSTSRRRNNSIEAGATRSSSFDEGVFEEKRRPAGIETEAVYWQQDGAHLQPEQNTQVVLNSILKDLKRP